MEARKIIQEFENRGYELIPVGSNVKYRLVEGDPQPGEIDPLLEELKQSKQQVIKLLNKPRSAEDILLSLTDQVDKVQLEGKQYHASNLVRLIIDFPCKLAWEDGGLKIKPGDYEDWDWFRTTFLKPNTEQIKELFQLAQQEHEEQIKQALR